MNDSVKDSDKEELPQEIPSAVSVRSGWSLTAWTAVTGIAILILFLSKRTKRSGNEVDPALAAADFSQTAADSPTASYSANPRPTPPAGLTGISLQELRRRSPILIANDAHSDASSDPKDVKVGDDIPAPSGFHTTIAATARATSAEDRTGVITQGKLLDAVLETAINTDRPGLLRALVSDDIFGDSGRMVLLPRGSRLVGQYDSGISQGQSRVFVVWQRVIRPDGVSVVLDSGGTDPLGQAGVAGNVHTHFMTMFGAATLLSMIGATTATVGVSPQDMNNSLAAYRTSVSQGFNDAANTVLGVFAHIRPTLTVKQGTPIKVLVARDLFFDPSTTNPDQLQVIP